jgi:general secretion pathway protein E
MDLTTSIAFADHLRRKKYLAADAPASTESSAGHSSGIALNKLWELTDLSASDFADEVAQFHKVPRVSLSELLAAPSLVKQFSRRFLREMMIFPHLSTEGKPTLAAADPSDVAAIRAAELVLGSPIAIKVTSFEDITTIHNQRLGEEDIAPAGFEPAAARDDDIESLRDLASGAPVVRAVNDLLENAVELRASDIHVEPFRTGLAVRLRVDGSSRAAAGADFTHQNSGRP